MCESSVLSCSDFGLVLLHWLFYLFLGCVRLFEFETWECMRMFHFSRFGKRNLTDFMLLCYGFLLVVCVCVCILFAFWWLYAIFFCYFFALKRQTLLWCILWSKWIGQRQRNIRFFHKGNSFLLQLGIKLLEWQNTEIGWELDSMFFSELVKHFLGHCIKCIKLFIFIVLCEMATVASML